MTTIISECRAKFPELFTLVVQIMLPEEIKVDNIAKMLPPLAMIYGILLKTRYPELILIQRCISMCLMNPTTDQNVYDQLNVLQCCLSYPQSQKLTKEFKHDIQAQLEEAVCENKNIRFIGDNLNFKTNVKHD